MQYYIHKVFPHDLDHEVGFTQDIYFDFFGRCDTLTFTKNGSPIHYYVTVNWVTDLRFGGEFKSMLPSTLEVGDFIRIDKKCNSYDLSIVKRGSADGKKIEAMLSPRQRHLIILNNTVVYKR